MPPKKDKSKCYDILWFSVLNIIFTFSLDPEERPRVRQSVARGSQWATDPPQPHIHVTWKLFFYFGKNVLVSFFCWSLGPHDCGPPIFSPCTSNRQRLFFGEICLCDLFLFLPSSCWPSWLLGHRSTPYIQSTMFYSFRIFIFSVKSSGLGEGDYLPPFLVYAHLLGPYQHIHHFESELKFLWRRLEWISTP